VPGVCHWGNTVGDSEYVWLDDGGYCWGWCDPLGVGSCDASEMGAYAGGGTDKGAGSSGGNFASITIMTVKR